MEYDTMKLSVKRLTQGCCVFFYPVNTDIELCFEGALLEGERSKVMISV